MLSTHEGHLPLSYRCIYVYTIQERLSRGPGRAARIKDPAPGTQILPFDITIAGANEYGAGASAKLYGVEILNEGFGTSIDDTVIEQQATFVAQTIAPLQAHHVCSRSRIFLYGGSVEDCRSQPGVGCGLKTILSHASEPFIPSTQTSRSSSSHSCLRVAHNDSYGPRRQRKCRC